MLTMRDFFLARAPGLKHGSVNQFLSARKVDDQPKRAVAVDVLGEQRLMIGYPLTRAIDSPAALMRGMISRGKRGSVQCRSQACSTRCMRGGFSE
jgi:hypothetical protein